MKKKLKQFYRAMKMEIHEHKSSFLVFVILRLLVIIIMILQLFNKNYENVFLCILTLTLFMIPSFVQVELKIELPTTLEIIILLFIFSAEILGEISAYYIKFPFWDTVLHTLNGFLAAAIGFSLVTILNRHDKFTFKLSPIFMAIVAFCFSMTIGVIWEFFECGMDQFFGLDMQKDTIVSSITSVMLDPNGENIPVTIDHIKTVTVNGIDLGLGGYLELGLLDTMKDLFVNFIGALLFSVIGYFYVKTRGKGKFAGKFIPRLKNRNADFMKIAEQEVEQEEREEKRLKEQEGAKK